MSNYEYLYREMARRLNEVKRVADGLDCPQMDSTLGREEAGRRLKQICFGNFGTPVRCEEFPQTSAGMWVRTSEKPPCKGFGEQKHILMWSPQWATWMRGMYTCWGPEKQPEWAMYNPVDDRFYDCPEAPEWWCEIEMPNIVTKE